MELKNAVAVCLISLFSATLVLLIARTLDTRAADRLEPQLARIAEQLEAIRQQGGIANLSSVVSQSEVPGDGLVAYYFHGNTRCVTCRAIEAQSREAVQTHFPNELQNGEVVWKILNYEEPSGAELAEKFEIQMPVVVLARMKDGQVDDWRRLDKVWALVGDKTAFTEFVRDELFAMLPTGDASSTETEESAIDAPLPTADPADIPLPNEPLEIPVPD